MFFLIGNEATRYQLSPNIYDLTPAQIQFYAIYAEKQHKAIEEARTTSTSTASSNGFKLDTTKDDPQTQREKMEIIKTMMGR